MPGLLLVFDRPLPSDLEQAKILPDLYFFATAKALKS